MHLREAGLRALLLVAGFLAALLVAETMARGYAHFGGDMGRILAAQDPLVLHIEPHGIDGYRQRPNDSHRYLNGTHATSNAMGFRGPLVERHKGADSFRIVLLGGSTTYGYGVEDEETVDSHMRKILRAKHRDVRFEVVNLALDGYDSYQLLQRLESDGLALSPDVVIVNSGINDVRNARFADLRIPDPRTVVWEGNLQQLRERANRGGPNLKELIAHYSYAARVPGLVRDHLVRWWTVSGRGTAVPHAAALDYFETNIRAIADLVRASGAKLILSTPPSSLESRYGPEDVSTQSYWIVDAATTQRYRDALASRLEGIAADYTARGWPVAYVSPDLPPELFLDDCHPTAEGYRVLAEVFVEALRPYLARRHPETRPEGGRA